MWPRTQQGHRSKVSHLATTVSESQICLLFTLRPTIIESQVDTCTEWLQNDLEYYKVKCTPFVCNWRYSNLNSTPFRCMTSRFDLHAIFYNSTECFQNDSDTTISNIPHICSTSASEFQCETSILNIYTYISINKVEISSDFCQLTTVTWSILEKARLIKNQLQKDYRSIWKFSKKKKKKNQKSIQ